ncbi:MAG: YybS family protein [Pseudomonadota bacterium]
MTQGPATPGPAPAVLGVLREPSLWLAAGATTVLFLAIMIVPLFGIFMGTFTPVPLIISYRARGRLFGLATGGAALVLVGAFYLLSGSPLGVLVFLEYCILGVVLGEGMLRGLPPGRLVGLGAGAVIAFGLVLLVATSSGEGEGPFSRGKSIVERQVRESLQLYDEVVSGSAAPDRLPPGRNPDDDLPAESRTESPFPDSNDAGIMDAGTPDARIEPLVEGLIRVFPSLMVMGTVLVSWANFLMTRMFLTRRGVTLPDQPNLKNWQAPEHLVWPLIGSGFALFLFSGAVSSLGLNGLIILGLVYFFQGLAIVAFWLDRKKAPRFFRVLTYTLIALQQYLTLGVALLGLFDMWLDFRKLKTITGGGAE